MSTAGTCVYMIPEMPVPEPSASAAKPETTGWRRVRRRRLVQQQVYPKGELPYVVVFNVHLDFPCLFAGLSAAGRVKYALRTSQNDSNTKARVPHLAGPYPRTRGTILTFGGHASTTALAPELQPHVQMFENQPLNARHRTIFRPLEVGKLVRWSIRAGECGVVRAALLLPPICARVDLAAFPLSSSPPPSTPARRAGLPFDGWGSPT
ncbi:hypothetical protein BD626DRAFT_170233 [Schizophyllum amplum]|uniref:Uncharacterized protein n=1 Tax=Schizophyllum amplum TaxID=97359 RepID=A0A550CQV3_9AGAR|nr:hypothetical protein BD626DRAFT_170233 [Auriculariopsis ampla]